MPEQTAGLPETAGLPSGGKPVDSAPARSGSELIDAAAAGGRLDARESDDLLAYFLANGELAGDTQETPYTVGLGHGPQARRFRCVLKPIEWAEWQDAIQRATNQTTGELDRFVMSSWVVARGLVSPALGPTVIAMQRDTPETAPVDAAALLRKMFRRQSGSLLELSGKVLELSKLANDGELSVKEIEAGKG